MVFEAIVVDLLNKFLKKYVENLDTSQLKIGIWGGDVVLNDLKLKSSLFDDLNLPMKVKWGKLGKFAMKIPWQNLYGSQAVVDIEELLMVVIPNNELKYDPVKEEKWALDRKHAKLKAIEEAKKRELESDTPKQNDGFIEKLLTQIIKNIQISISNIHIRYEDKTTIPGSPFSFGVTMSKLSAQTTVNDATAAYSELMEQKDGFICKVVNLEGLAVYWNSSSTLFSDLPGEDLVNFLVESIPQANYRPEGFIYVFGPLCASAFLRLNSKPENDGSNFSIPKVFVNVHLREIELAVTRNQFCDAMAYLQDFQRIYAGAKFRKYRPVDTPVIGHTKEWWLFAYKAVVEDISRRRKEWCWQNIKEHRMMCRRYSTLFITKLNSKKIAPDIEEELNELEKKLNVLNLVLIREQAYVEVERSNLKKSEMKTGGWFSGWFGYGSETRSSPSEDELVKKLQSVMTTKEKEKLYKAIGYEESAPPTNYPPTFVEFQFWFKLDEIKMTVFDDHLKDLTPVMTVSVKAVQIEFEQRPSAFAMKFVMRIGNFRVTGKEETDNTFPELVTSNCTENESLVEILYESKPLCASCDQRVIVNARPLRIVYHAETINMVRDIFTTGGSDEMNKIVAATSSSLPTFQKITTFGLQYAIEKRLILEVKVNIMSSYIIIPFGGVFNPNKDMLVVVLGKLSVETTENEQKYLSVKQMFLQGTTNEEIFSTVLSASYTKFRCQLTGVQVLLQLSGEDWVHASNLRGPSPLRFLESTDLVVTIKKSLVTDDARIPKMIVEGNLPSLTFNFSEERFVSFAALLCSIPTKTPETHKMPKKNITPSTWSLQSIGTQLESKFVHIQKGYVKHDDYEQGIDFVGHFQMNELMVNVSKNKEPQKSETSPKEKEEKFLNLRLIKLEIDLTSKTFETIHLLKLGSIEFKQYHHKTSLPFVTTKILDQDYYLFLAEYINLDTKVPDFYTKRHATINRVTLNIAPINVVLNKEALLAQMAFAKTVERRLEMVKGNCTRDRTADAGKPKETIYEEPNENQHADKKVISIGKRFRKKRPQKEVIDFFLVANLNEIDIVIEYEGQGIAEFSLKGGSLETSTRKSSTTLDLKLREISLTDLSPLTLHKKIVESLETQTLFSRLTLYNSEYFGTEKPIDMSLDAELGGLRLTFVNAFFSRAFAFLNAFQSQIETLKVGAHVAAQKAKENVMKAYHNAAQICLNVKIAAPLLVIPRNSSSLEALVVDLGVLTIKNSITELDCTTETDNKTRPLIDTMLFHLQNLKVSRCTFCEDLSDSENERNFLVPVSFELVIKRNLSTAWFRVVPQLEILARLAAIHITLTHTDLCSISSTIRENLSEGDAVGSHRRLPHHHHATEHKPKASGEYEEHHEEHHEVELSSDTEQESNLYTVVKFMFSMDSIVFDAISEVNKVNDEREKEAGLARFVLESISLKGRMFSDGSIYCSVMLVSCLLDDKRPGKAGRITRLMERTRDPGGESRYEILPVNSMLEITYQKKGFDSFVDVRVYKFTLILSMDFLQKLGKFFTVDDVGYLDTSEHQKNIMKVERHLIHKEGQERHPTFTINLRLEKPDIAIVENMDSIDTDALIFHTEMVMKYRVAGKRQVISGTLIDIELYSCCFNPAKRRHTMYQVIKPFTVSIAGSTPQDHGLHVDICLTEISITINPGIVQLISKCYEALFFDSSIRNVNLEEKLYSDLWDVKAFNPDDYWFLKMEEGMDVLSIISSRSSVSYSDKYAVVEEICLLAIPSIKLWFEGRLSKHSKPLLLLELGFQMQCYNWSSKLTINNSLSIQMQYFNNVISAWEPLIEPVEKIAENRKHSYTPWELNCSLLFGDEGDLEDLRPPKVAVTLSSTEVLQLTLTKTCVEVLKSMLDMYTSAVIKGEVKIDPDLPPYIVKNETGLIVEILLEESGLQACRALDKTYKIVKLESDSEVELQGVASDSSDLIKSSTLHIKKEGRMLIKFPMCEDAVFELPLGVSSKRYYPMTLDKFDKGEVWGLVSDILILDNVTTVILRSILQVINYFVEPINIHSLSEDGKEAEFVGTVEGNSEFCLPFHAIYNTNKKLFFSVNGYSLSVQSFDWENIKKEINVSVLLQCNSKIPENKDPFFIQAVGEAEQIYYSNMRYKTMSSMCYIIHLQPTVKIFNSLPVSLIICFQGSAAEKLLQPGNNLQITNAEPGISTVTLRITSYLEKEWSCKEKIPQNPSEFLIWRFESYNGLTREVINLGVHCIFKRKTAVYTIYCPYLMVNKTHHLLSYKFDGNSTVVYHPADLTLPVMFSPPNRKFFGKKSAYLQVGQSAWSDKFPVDVAGSGGTVECEDSSANITYKISVTITLTYNSLTRIVVFTPFYVFMNETNFTIECQESDFLNESWLPIPPKSCLPFWPKSHAKSKTIQIRPKDSGSVTPAFGYESTDSCLLRLSHKCGGIFVNIQATQSCTYITFDLYEPGQAPALIINHSEKVIKLYEESTKFTITLKPLEQVYHSWVAPTGSRKLVLTNAKRDKVFLFLDQDTDGVVVTAKGEPVLYVSFLDGTQRILLFTEDKELSSSNICNRVTRSGIEVICKLHGIGLSLVNNINRMELLYMGFVSSGIVWEAKKYGKLLFKSMNKSDIYDLENAYIRYQNDNEVKANVEPIVEVTDKLTVNFEKMEMIKPNRRILKRTFEPGLWCAYRIMDDQVMLHLKVNKIQIDNQILGCIFPVLLSPIPPPKTVATLYQGPKPFLELSVVKIAADRSGVQQYKYFKLLVQEFHVKIDIGIIQQLWQFLAAAEMSDEEEKLCFKKDMEFTLKPLVSHVEVVSTKEQKNFYDLLHFTPLKIHFSFSLAGNIGTGSLPPSVSVMLQSLGMTLTDMHDVIFRLSYFERKCIFLTNTQLKNEVVSHYYGQIIRQAYVLILGLDVIGNPYGLIVGIGEGVEAFFYEPFQGIIQGPSEFAAGVSIGCKSLFGHTVRSTAGTLGKLTETLGKGLAVLSLDKEYQLQRMEAQNRQENIQASMARSGRGLVMGVFEGVTGVVRKPLEGAKEEGVGGFFKGMGKGMMGLVTRPVSGVVDFASTSLNAVKRVADSNPENRRIRPPRFFRDDTLVEPYNLLDAEGNCIFYAICKRKYCSTDKYEYHVELKGKEVVVLTNRRIILAELSEVFGTWQEHMAITWRSMPDRPRCHSKGIALTIAPKNEASKKDKPDIKILLVENLILREEMCKKMKELYQLELGNI